MALRLLTPVLRLRYGVPEGLAALAHSVRFDLVRLKEAMMLLIANEAPLGPEWLDHPLKGEWADHRECHIGGDFLLIYQIEANTINFVRSGTHSELFSN